MTENDKELLNEISKKLSACLRDIKHNDLWTAETNEAGEIIVKCLAVLNKEAVMLVKTK